LLADGSVLEGHGLEPDIEIGPSKDEQRGNLDRDATLRAAYQQLT